MNWLLLATLFGAVHTQPLFFRPHQSGKNQKGVCCSDGTCCPPGKTCGPNPGQCVGGGDLLTGLVPATPTKQLTYVFCPGSQVICADGNTCCRRPGGGILCCRYSNAVCCNDGLHCCPFGLQCTQGGGCTGGALDEMWSLMKPALNRNKVPCDETHQCPDDHTCCRDQTGRWKCCPHSKGVCCDDRRHCCPQGTECDTRGRCTGDSLADWFLKTPARRLTGVICPDGWSECQDGQTCCKQPSGNWACCPLPKAVCCSDGRHCCPQGTTCSLSTRTCNKGDLQIDWAEKTPARELKAVPCPGGRYVCPDSTKCCAKPSGGYGCCPLATPVCCSDGDHCCAQGYTCGVKTCNKGDLQIDWAEKTPARELKTVPCPGGRYVCPDNTKCCARPTGGYGCCPLADPVCCSDGVHCCPQGTTCSVSSGRCNKGDLQIDWAEKTPARELKTVPCPGGQYVCPDYYKCCARPTGGFGCCPRADALCCSDGKHCCPKDTRCDMKAGKCVKGDSLVDMFEKIPALQLTNSVCPDGKLECQDDTTCCQLPAGDWGCCPLP